VCYSSVFIWFCSLHLGIRARLMVFDAVQKLETVEIDVEGDSKESMSIEE
jgi:hypothetical protein